MKVIRYSFANGENFTVLLEEDSFIEVRKERVKGYIKEGFIISNKSFNQEKVHDKLVEFPNKDFCLVPQQFGTDFDKLVDEKFPRSAKKSSVLEGNIKEILENVLFKNSSAGKDESIKQRFLGALKFSDEYEIQLEKNEDIEAELDNNKDEASSKASSSWSKILKEPSFIIGVVVVVIFAWALLIELPILQELQQAQIGTESKDASKVSLLNHAITALHDNKTVYAKYWAQRIGKSDEKANAILGAVKQVEEGKNYEKSLEKAEIALKKDKPEIDRAEVWVNKAIELGKNKESPRIKNILARIDSVKPLPTLTPEEKTLEDLQLKAEKAEKNKNCVSVTSKNKEETETVLGLTNQLINKGGKKEVAIGLVKKCLDLYLGNNSGLTKDKACERIKKLKIESLVSSEIGEYNGQDIKDKCGSSP